MKKYYQFNNSFQIDYDHLQKYNGYSKLNTYDENDTIVIINGKNLSACHIK